MKIELDEVPEILQKLGIVPKNAKKEMAYIYADTGKEEAVSLRGSYLSDNSNAGVGALDLSNSRSHGDTYIGFRSAYAEFEELETKDTSLAFKLLHRIYGKYNTTKRRKRQ